MPVLYRKTGTSKSDLELARSRDFASKLYESLYFIQVDFEKLSTSVLKLVEPTATDSKQIQLLQNISTEGTGM
jgi:hypothetical protein